MAAAPVSTSYQDDLQEEQTGPGYQPRQLLLLGSGQAHVHVLKSLAERPLVGVRVVLLAQQSAQVHSGMVPGFIAGHYTLDQCAVALEPLVRKAGVHWLQHSVRHLDTAHQAVLLDDGNRVHYDWLSINTAPVQQREQIEQRIPGAREHGLFMRPIEGFAALWPQVAAMGAKKALRVTVVGGGAAGFELACAVRHRLPNAAVTLLAGTAPLGEAFSDAVQQRMAQALRARNITVLQDIAVRIKSDEVRLGSGAGLASDVSILSTGAQAPLWLAGSGLQLDAKGRIAVNAFQQSTSHPSVFAIGEICSRDGALSAVAPAQAADAGANLAQNLGHVVTGATPQRAFHPGQGLRMLSCGGRYAIASWGGSSAEGHWLWWLKNWQDKRLIARYSS